MERKLRKIIRYPVVEKMTGLSRVTIWRMVKAGTFPKPIQLGSGSVGFFEDECVEWQEEKAASRG
ncbi:helix-turn-helix transcriptional regulator [Syntrophus buswellii]|uniref:helix-turn-helix transcriptional regulator n=1 Tax=Syntrophus buswellii TaxID=43774 RepID=UPI0038D4B164